MLSPNHGGSGRYARADAAQQALLGSVVMASTPTSAECACLGTHLALRQAPDDGSGLEQPRACMRAHFAVNTAFKRTFTHDPYLGCWGTRMHVLKRLNFGLMHQ